MRNPVNDPNENVQEAPSVRHAARTVEVSRQQSRNAANKAQTINQISSSLGNALGEFMEGKRKAELDRRYEEAYFKQGEKQGLDEYQKDLKRTGFTEFIYGGQSPEYQGALDAAATNASNALFTEQQDFVVNGIGADMTPDVYRGYLKEQVKNYHDTQFGDAPDATHAFMKNWMKNSNELTRIHRKEFAVREQQKAAQTVAEGVQTTLSMIKVLGESNPDRTSEMIQDLADGKSIPSGMSYAAGRNVMVSELLTAARNHDYLALNVLNRSGFNLDGKQLKELRAVRRIIDEDNVNMVTAARFKLEAAIESGTEDEVKVAGQEFLRVQSTVASRNTETSKHMATVYGSDRHLGILNNQYAKKVEDEYKLASEERVELFKTWSINTAASLERNKGSSGNMSNVAQLAQEQFTKLLPSLPPAEADRLAAETNLMLAKYGVQIQNQTEDERKEFSKAIAKGVTEDEVASYYDIHKAPTGEAKRDRLAEYIDKLDNQLLDTRLHPEAVTAIQKVRTRAQKKLDTWESAAEEKQRKITEAENKKAEEKRLLDLGTESLLAGKGFTVFKTADKNKHIEAAVTQVVNQVDPDTEVEGVEKLRRVMSNVTTLDSWLTGTRPFGAALHRSAQVKTAVQNMAISLRDYDEETNKYSDDQKAAAQSLQLLKQRAPTLYNTAFPTSREALELELQLEAIQRGEGVVETNRKIDNVIANSDKIPAKKYNADMVLSKLGLGTAPSDIQDAAYSRYKDMLPLGSDKALEAAKSYMQDVNTVVGDRVVLYGGSFGEVNGNSLTDVMNNMEKTYQSGSLTKSGWTDALEQLTGNSVDNNGAPLRSLDQVPGVKVSVLNGNIVLEYKDIIWPVNRSTIEVELRGYEEFTKRARSHSWATGRWVN